MLFVTQSSAQESKQIQDLYKELDSLFSNEEIPANLFEIADSLLALEKAKFSGIGIRFAYVSEVMSAGRVFGPEQFGFIPGFTYYHRSGLSAGATGYASSNNEPSYYLTTLNVSYQRIWKQKFSALIQQDYYLYHDTLSSHAFQHSSQVAGSWLHKYADAMVDYSVFYGNDVAHRITSALNARLKIRPARFVDAITFMPGLSAQFGNADVYFWRQPRTAAADLYRIVTTNNYPRLTRREYIKLTYLLETDRKLAAGYFLRQRDYTFQEIADLFEQYEEGTISSVDTFGFMNLSLSCPVNIRRKNFSLLLNYTYNLPQKLPGETYEYEPTGFFSVTLSYMISKLR